jgi:hypothetical protein
MVAKLPEGADHELVWEDPPANEDRFAVTPWVLRLLPLKAQPGRWARIQTCHRQRAYESVNHLLKRTTRKPPGRWEFRAGWLEEALTTAKVDDKRAITHGVWARYLGPEEAAEAEAPLLEEKVDPVSPPAPPPPPPPVPARVPHRAGASGRPTWGTCTLPSCGKAFEVPRFGRIPEYCPGPDRRCRRKAQALAVKEKRRETSVPADGHKGAPCISQACTKPRPHSRSRWCTDSQPRKAPAWKAPSETAPTAPPAATKAPPSAPAPAALPYPNEPAPRRRPDPLVDVVDERMTEAHKAGNKCARRRCSRQAAPGSAWCQPQRLCEGRSAALDAPAPTGKLVMPDSMLMRKFGERSDHAKAAVAERHEGQEGK